MFCLIIFLFIWLMCGKCNVPFLSISYLGDVSFDAFGQFDAGFAEELGQLIWDVLVLIQSI